MTARPALSGEFSDLAAADLLRLLAGGAKSGIVRCEGPRRTDIALHQGAVTWAESGTGANLEAIVRAAGSADDATIDAAVESARRSGSLAGALLEAGAAPERVSMLLLDHTTSELVELVAAEGGSFEFFEGATHALGAELSWPVDLVLDTVDTRLGVLPRQRSTIADDDRPVRLAEPADDAQPVTLDPAEWRVAVRVDGRAGVAAIAGETGWSPFRVRELLCALADRGLLVVT